LILSSIYLFKFELDHLLFKNLKLRRVMIILSYVIKS